MILVEWGSIQLGRTRQMLGLPEHHGLWWSCVVIPKRSRRGRRQMLSQSRYRRCHYLLQLHQGHIGHQVRIAQKLRSLLAFSQSNLQIHSLVPYLGWAASLVWWKSWWECRASRKRHWLHVVVLQHDRRNVDYLIYSYLRPVDRWSYNITQNTSRKAPNPWSVSENDTNDVV